MIDFRKLDAYELLMQEDLPDVLSRGYLLRHKKSCARVMLIENDDENKVFNIAFRTTPTNSTGVAHIMEHTVLCGSRKYPVKDPFVELVKGSLNTFMNAMTYPDKTMYPVASCNDQDFSNLMDVYLDAVLYPNIFQKEEIFRQEGWSYQLDAPDGEIEYNGVVYNEMKGAFSSPDDIVEREIMNSLFPDTTYHYDSGGDPAAIPQLSYAEYLDFHRTYYHPSNSYIYLYGAVDFEERLTWLDREYLSAFDRIDVRSSIPLQKPFDQMLTVRRRYPVGQDGSEEKATYLTWNAVIGTSLDTRLSSAFAVLDYVLLSSPGAPLKQALLDDGIGMDIVSSYDSGTLQPVFSIIAKGADEKDEARFLETIDRTLARICEEGVDEKAVLAALNVMEFRFREADYGHIPKGLMYGIDVFDSWLYDDNRPFDYLRQLDVFAWLKKQAGTDYYVGLIRQYLIENTHKSSVIVSPQRGMTALTEKETKQKLADYKASLSPAEIDEMVAATERLRAYQETPSTQEELEKLPMLSRSDLTRETKELRNDVYFADGAWLIHHDYNTNGISYLQILFDASCVPAEDLPYLSLLRSVLGMVDTEHYTYQELANEINRNTGGISPSLSVFPDRSDTQKVKLAFGIRMRTLDEGIGYCFDMMEEILFTSRLDQEKRILEILRRLVSSCENRLISSGSATAVVRAMAGFSMSGYISECFDGVRFYDTMRDLEKHFEEKKEFLFDKLKQLLSSLLRPEAVLADHTGDASLKAEIRMGISSLMARLTQKLGDELPSRTDDGKTAESAEKCALNVLSYYPPIDLETVREGLKTPAKVQYVARCGNFRKAGFDFTGALMVFRTIMSYEYLWNHIRVMGGAYGCSGSFQPNGDGGWSSYRDPQLRKTLEVFEGVPAYLRDFNISDRDMTKYVIGTVSDMDIPLTPSTEGGRSLRALLTGTSVEDLQKVRDEVLDADQESIRALAPLTEAVLAQHCQCVLGNEDRITQDQDLFDSIRDL